MRTATVLTSLVRMRSWRWRLLIFSIPSLHEGAREFGKALAPFFLRHIGRHLRHDAAIAEHIGNPDRIRKEPEHRHVIGRVADKRNPLARMIGIETKNVMKQAPRHRE